MHQESDGNGATERRVGKAGVQVAIDVINRPSGRRTLELPHLPQVGEMIPDPDTGEIGHLVVRSRPSFDASLIPRIEVVYVNTDDDLDS